MPEGPIRIGRSRLLLIATSLAWIAAVGPRLGLKECSEWDAAQLGLATRRYSIREHRPHPPGYWLYVQLLKPVAAVTGDPVRALAFLSCAMAVAAVWMMARWCGLPPAICLAFSPLVLFLAPAQSTYMAEVLTSVGTAWLTARVIEGETRLLPWLFGWTGLWAGLRPNTLAYCVALLMVAAFYARHEWRRYWWPAALAGLCSVLLWLAPQVYNVGSWHEYTSLVKGQLDSSARKTSVFFGAARGEQIRTFLWPFVWLSFAAGPAALTRLLNGAGKEESARWRQWWFFAAWALPAAIQVFFVHSPKVGYVAFLIAPLVVLAAKGLTLRWAYIGAAISLAATFFPWPMLEAAGAPPWLLDPISQALPRRQHEIEAAHVRLRRVLGPIAPGTLGIAALNGNEGISHRTLCWSHPQIRWVLWEESKVEGTEPFVVVAPQGSHWDRHPVHELATDPDFTVFASPGVLLQEPKQ